MASPTLRSATTVMQVASSNKDKFILPLVIGGLTVCLLVVATVIILLLCKRRDKRGNAEETVESGHQPALLVRLRKWLVRRKQKSINKSIGAGCRNPTDGGRLARGYDVVRTPALERAPRRPPLVHMTSISECGTLGSHCHSDAGFVTERTLQRDGYVSIEKGGHVDHVLPDFIGSDAALGNGRANSIPIRILTSVSVIPVQADALARRCVDVSRRPSTPLAEGHSAVGQELHVYARVEEPSWTRVSDSKHFQLVSQHGQSSLDVARDAQLGEYVVVSKGGTRYNIPSSLPKYEPPDYVPQRDGRSKSIGTNVKASKVEGQGILVDQDLSKSDKQGTQYVSYASLCSNQGSLFDVTKPELKIRTKTT